MQPIGRRSALAAVAIVGLITSVDLAAPPPRQTPTHHGAPLLATPSFKVSWVRDEVQLTGHTFSRQHEEDLLRAAGSEFAGANITSTFEPLGIVPNYWRELTLALPGLLRGSLSGHVELNPWSVNLSVVTSDSVSLMARAADFDAQLPTAVDLHSDVIVVDGDFSVTDACAYAARRFSIGEVGFEENTTVLRSSALPRLQRVAALATSCRSALLQITGHTDASGNENWNRTLSLQRANAVADYLETLGVERRRMQQQGVGSSAPLRSNATRYGRSKNRRIVIRFTLP